MNFLELKCYIQTNDFKNKVIEIYQDESLIDYQILRYTDAINAFMKQYPLTNESDNIHLFSAPGRSEICGNHTDHENGNVVAAAINLDALAVVSSSEDGIIRILSKGIDPIEIDVNIFDIVDGVLTPPMDSNEFGTTTALVKGVLAGFLQRGYAIGGFNAYITSDVLIGAGLSSSAAFETLIGAILDSLYNDESINQAIYGIVGGYAENEYFGKPCGLMDQLACAVGNLIHIDFANSYEPDINVVVQPDFLKNYSLCITDTKGSHADLTDEYAAVPAEMKKVASFFGKDVLFDITFEEILNNISKLREFTSDRAILRAIHYVNENQRAISCMESLKNNDQKEFIRIIRESGDSSYKYLQNVYSRNDTNRQNLSLALCIADNILGKDEAFRVHGGGFAGTTQAFVKKENTAKYTKAMDEIFGHGSCKALFINEKGAKKII